MMRYAKPTMIAVAMLVCVLAPFVSFDRDRIWPKSTTAKPLALVGLNKLPASIDQELDATDSGIPELSNPNNYPPTRVIRLEPPAQYMGWFKQQTDVQAFENHHVEASLFERKVRLSYSGVSGFSLVVETPLGKPVDWAWDVTELEKTSSDLNSRNHCSIAGVIQVDVRPNLRFNFPFEAKITCDDKKSKNVFEPYYPLHAIVTWQKPECWKKVE